MSHTIAQQQEFITLWKLTIQNYAAGGETITAAEVGATIATVQAVFFANVPANQNSLGSVLFPVLVAGKVQLWRFNAGTFAEIPTTANLNAVVFAQVLLG